MSESRMELVRSLCAELVAEAVPEARNAKACEGCGKQVKPGGPTVWQRPMSLRWAIQITRPGLVNELIGVIRHVWGAVDRGS